MLLQLLDSLGQGMFLSYMTFYQARAQQIWKGFLRSLGIMELPFAGLMILPHLLFFGLHQLLVRLSLAYLQDAKCGH